MKSIKKSLLLLTYGSLALVQSLNPYEDFPTLSIIARTFWGHEKAYLKFYRKSHQLFWPREYEKSEVVLVLDEEDRRNHDAGNRLREIAPYPTILYERHPGNGVLNKGWRDGNDGYCRQIYSNFYLDMQSDKEFVGFVDADTSYLTPLTPDLLFKQVNGTFKPVMYAYNDPYASFMCLDIGERALGKSCVAEFMMTQGFPIIAKRDHIRQCRETIIKNLGVDTFEQAFAIMSAGVVMSQQNIIGNYLYHYHREDYDWHIRESRGNGHAWMRGFQVKDDQDPYRNSYNIPTIGKMAHDDYGCCAWEELSCVAIGFHSPDCEKIAPDRRAAMKNYVDYKLGTDIYCNPPCKRLEKTWENPALGITWQSTVDQHWTNIARIVDDAKSRGKMAFGCQFWRESSSNQDVRKPNSPYKQSYDLPSAQSTQRRLIAVRHNDTDSIQRALSSSKEFEVSYGKSLAAWREPLVTHRPYFISNGTIPDHPVLPTVQPTLLPTLSPTLSPTYAPSVTEQMNNTQHTMTGSKLARVTIPTDAKTVYVDNPPVNKGSPPPVPRHVSTKGQSVSTTPPPRPTPSFPPGLSPQIQQSAAPQQARQSVVETTIPVPATVATSQQQHVITPRERVQHRVPQTQQQHHSSVNTASNLPLQQSPPRTPAVVQQSAPNDPTRQVPLNRPKTVYSPHASGHQAVKHPQQQHQQQHLQQHQQHLRSEPAARQQVGGNTP